MPGDTVIGARADVNIIAGVIPTVDSPISLERWGEILGCSEDTLRRWLRERSVPVLRVPGGGIYVRSAAMFADCPERPIDPSEVKRGGYRPRKKQE